MKAFYHVVYCDNETGRESLQAYLDAVEASQWWRSRYVLAHHYINGLHHTFMIKRRGVGKGIYEVGVESLR